MYIEDYWYIQGDKKKTHCFLWDGSGGLFRLKTKGLFQLIDVGFKSIEEMNPLLLSTEWDEAAGDNPWSRKATIKIFSNEEAYNEYKNGN